MLNVAVVVAVVETVGGSHMFQTGILHTNPMVRMLNFGATRSNCTKNIRHSLMTRLHPVSEFQPKAIVNLLIIISGCIRLLWLPLKRGDRMMVPVTNLAIHVTERSQKQWM